MAIYINYILSNGYADSYPVSNITVEGDLMFFTWTIKREVTQVAGGIKFIVCAKKTDDQGNEVNHWNSELCEDMYVSKGMETVPQIASEYPDLITELLLRMSRVEEINVQAGEMQELLNETQAAADKAEEAKNVATDESNYIKNNYANSIKGEASGSVIRVDDVSPVEHTINTRVHGKNFIDMTKIPTQDSTSVNYISAVGEGFIEITCTDAYDGNGHVNTSIKLKDLCPQMVAGKQYILSATSDSWNKCIYLAQLDLFWQFKESLTVTEEMLDCSVGFYGYAPYRGQEPGVCRTYDIQIEEGSSITEYEPYIDPTTVTVRRLGKNLFPVNEATLAKTNAWGLQPMGQVILAPGTYTARCKFKQTGTDKSTVSLSIRDHTDAIDTIATANSTGISGVLETTFEVTSERKGIQIYLYSNNTANALNTECVFTDIQLELCSEPTEFEKYITFESYTPAVDGTVAVTSISPTMTIYAITPGVTIDAEYNRDTNYVIGGIKDDALTAITTLPSGTTNVWELQSGLYRVPSYVTVNANTKETLPKPTKSYSYLYVSGRSYTGSADQRYIVGWAYMVSTIYDNRYAAKVFTGSTYTDGKARPGESTSELATMAKLKAYVDKAIGGIENGSY
jgi:hypothetical protein